MEKQISESVQTSDTIDLKQEVSSQVLPKEIHSDSSSRAAADDLDGKLEVVQESPKDGERKYISGVKLAMVTTAVTLVCFLVLLDTSIIVTVGCLRPVLWIRLTPHRLFR